MATKVSIISAINTKVGTTSYSAWRIGLTHDPAERRQYWTETQSQSTGSWSQWLADSLSDAQELESYFIQKGMRVGQVEICRPADQSTSISSRLVSTRPPRQSPALS